MLVKSPSKLFLARSPWFQFSDEVVCSALLCNNSTDSHMHFSFCITCTALQESFLTTTCHYTSIRKNEHNLDTNIADLIPFLQSPPYEEDSASTGIHMISSTGWMYMKQLSVRVKLIQHPSNLPTKTIPLQCICKASRLHTAHQKPV